MRALVARPEHDRLAAVALLVSLSLALLAAGSARTVGLFTGTTSNPANTLATGTSVWFDATAQAMSVCSGTNGSLDCSFGSRGRPASATATFAVTNKNAANNTFSVAVVDGTGPAAISTLVTAAFPGNKATKNVGPGATATVSVTLTTGVGTATGTYRGSVLLTDSTSGSATSIPISVTVQ